MKRRDIFDVVLVLVVLVLAALSRFGLERPEPPVDALLAVLFGQDLLVYLVLGTVAGVAFVGYIAVYLPWKASQRGPGRRQ